MHCEYSVNSTFQKSAIFISRNKTAFQGIYLGAIQAIIILSACMLQTCTQHEFQRLPINKQQLEPTNSSPPSNEPPPLKNMEPKENIPYPARYIALID